MTVYRHVLLTGVAYPQRAAVYIQEGSRKWVDGKPMVKFLGHFVPQDGWVASRQEALRAAAAEIREIVGQMLQVAERFEQGDER